MLGVGLGFTFMVAVVGIGLMQVFEAVPGSQAALRVVSVAYLLYLAWKIANAAPPEAGGATGRPLTFLQAALFQWANPKAWAMALTAITLYAPSRELGAVLVVAAVFGAINLPSVGCWTLMGRAIRRWLTSHGRLRLFNRTMAVLLVASLWPMFEHLG
jgi:threonine/homoserine/homoserine lactone efflux protein